MPSSFIRYEILLPVKHSDGTEVSELKHRECFVEVSNEFGGATLEPQRLLGRWLHKGQEFQEPMIRILVEVEDAPENHLWFVSWKQTLVDRFEQIDIRMTWHPIHVV